MTPQERAALVARMAEARRHAQFDGDADTIAEAETVIEADGERLDKNEWQVWERSYDGMAERLSALAQQVVTLRAALERVSKDLRLVRNHDCTVQDISEVTEDAIAAALAQTEPKVTT